MYTLFTQKGTVYSSKYFRYGSLITALVFLVFVMFGLYFIVMDGNYGAFIGSVLVFLLYIYKFGANVELDTETKVITASRFGFLKKQLTFNEFYNFEVVKHMALGFIPNGTDLNILVERGDQIYPMILFDRLSSKKKIDTVMDEMRQIMSVEVNVNN